MDDEQASETKAEPAFRSSSPSPQRSLDSASDAVRASPNTADNLLTERDAYRLFGHLLEDKELRMARQAGRLGYLRRKRTIFYHRTELEAFISGLLDKDYVSPCPTMRSSAGTLSVREVQPTLVPRGVAEATQGVTPEVLQRALEILGRAKR